MDLITVAVVVIVALLAHVALYRWVRFKVHEGAVLHYMREAANSGAADHHHSADIALHTALKEERVTAVCERSTEITRHQTAPDSWRES